MVSRFCGDVCSEVFFLDGLIDTILFLCISDVFQARKQKNKNRPRVRGSSGNWEPDKLTLEEIKKYKHDMGFSTTVKAT
jgi:hypothetical protein